jgi:hypothetical protein
MLTPSGFELIRTRHANEKDVEGRFSMAIAIAAMLIPSDFELSEHSVPARQATRTGGISVTMSGWCAGIIRLRSERDLICRRDRRCL